MTCAACEQPLGEPIFASGAPFSITSLCERVPGETRVFFCQACQHVQTTAMADLATYYDQTYQILIDTEDEDQLYQVVDGEPIYRVQHQVETLLAKLGLPLHGRILDFGCAKSATMKALLKLRPDLQVHLFDVSELYLPFWRRFLPPDRWATYATPPVWAGSFDVVTSFFALEHVAAPRAMARAIAELLRPGGTAYLIIPNVYANPADFIVVDHVNHFCRRSLEAVLVAAGLGDIEVDDTAHAGAWVVTARKGWAATLSAPDATLGARVADLAAYWQHAGDQVRAFEQAAGPLPAAIYGSGFYGTYVLTCLLAPERVEVFLDQNPHRQGQTLLDRPILAPGALPAHIQLLYAGLNPAVARATLATHPSLAARDVCYL